MGWRSSGKSAPLPDDWSRYVGGAFLFAEYTADDTLLGMDVLIALGGVVLGFALSFGGTYMRDRRVTREERGSLASALLVEVMSQAGWCRRCTSTWNVLDAGHSHTEVKVALQHRPPRATAYEAMASEIHKLGADTAARVFAFYGSMDLVRAHIDGWAKKRESEPLTGSDVGDLAKKWQAACFNGIVAIKTLNKTADFERKPNDAEVMDGLLNDLEVLAEGDIPEGRLAN